MIKVLFSKIQTEILEQISKAKEDIKISVAWFNNSIIFDGLLQRLEQINISLIISNDVNNYQNGLGFQNFIDKGGVLFLPNDKKLMHHKFLIIDSKVVMTGSYNFTFGAENSNKENVILIDNNQLVVDSFMFEFETLIKSSDKIKEFDKSINKESSLLIRVITIPENEDLSYEIENLTAEDTLTQSLFKLHNTGQIKIAREMIRLAENTLKNSTNKKLLYATSLILYGNSEIELADHYFFRITTNKGDREFAMSCAIFKVNLSSDQIFF